MAPRRGWAAAGAAAAVIALLAGRQFAAVAVLQETPVQLEVTSAGDEPTAVCPHETRCTLRAAIALVNADGPPTSYAVVFREAVFPASAPATIAVVGERLPPVTRAAVSIDGTGRGVWVDGTQLPADEGAPGLAFEGSGATVRNIAIHNFGGACLLLAGPSATASGNRLGGCATGIEARGGDAVLTGNRVGFGAGRDAAAPVGTGILVAAGGATVGGVLEGAGNRVGNADAGIVVGSGDGAAFAGARLVRNLVGEDAAGNPAPVGVSIALRAPSSGTLAEENRLANATTGIEAAGEANTGNTFARNVFAAIAGLAIDLGADGVRDPADEGDADAGPNTRLNAPVISRAVQVRISGSAGPGCGGCAVALYLASHTPGGALDYGAAPVPGLVATTDATGAFVFDNPPVAPGQWVIAIVTDTSGNTSEFGPSARVGAGVVQCANVPLQPGWNLAGFFGPAAVALGMAYPPGGTSSATSLVNAIHHLPPGSEEYQSWFAGTVGNRTLNALTPGDAYWFHAAAPVASGGGFTLTIPVPVALKTGWNAFVYIGASAHVLDALASIAGRHGDVYRWLAAGESSHWQGFGTGAVPVWAQGFTTMDACGAYFVFVTEDVTLNPLQP